MILGLRYLDFGILLGFLGAVLAVGVYASRSVKHESDFYLGGRRMGKALQFFINFGNATDTNAAPTMASQVFREGVSGMWLQLQTLFFTPLCWFTQPWFRRARVITMADMFVDRFNSRSVAAAYAAFNVMVAVITLALGNLGGYSVVEAMMVKPQSAYTQAERLEVSNFNELQNLQAAKKAAGGVVTTQGAATAAAPSAPAGAAAMADVIAPVFTTAQNARLEELSALNAKAPFHSQIGALSKWEFYLSYNVIVAIYIMMGGLQAAAITDAIQGILILIMSILLLPLGLFAVHGFSGLHAVVPRVNFYLTGTATSEFTWYSIVAVTFASFIQIMALQHNMAAAGSATNENTARFGMIVGGFTKRIILIMWMLCGLLAIALLTGHLENPDFAWGRLSLNLLPMGLLGLMLSGMLLGHMPAVGLTAVSVSGLLTRNLYEPLFPGKSPRHYLRFGQAVIPFILAASVFIAWTSSGLGSLTAIMITFNTFFGAVVFLMFFWRRLTVPAILISFFIWIFLQAVIPPLVGFTSLRQNDFLTMQTHATTRQVIRGATAADVTAGRAKSVNETVTVDQPVPPIPLFFDGKVVPVDPHDASRGVEGQGHFNVENLVMYYPLKAVHLDMRNFSKAGLTTVRWFFAGLFPFVILILLSWITPRTAPELADRFYVKQKTPVGGTPEEEREEVEKSFQNPHRFDYKKLFPGTQWEFSKWTKEDYIGFFGCCLVVVAIVGLLYGVLHIGAS
ncbi:MAG TPA: hypothetical protein VH253_05015 [Phycisphaerae bacterium]|nr:hypothetical protein [Phycisphaerae bacterium]